MIRGPNFWGPCAVAHLAPANRRPCKHAFKCIRTRLVVIRRKKQAMIRFLKKDIADLLSNGLDAHAFGRMDGLVIEMNHASCYDMIEQFCDYIGKQLNSLQKQRDCPQETREAVSTLIFAAARFPDLRELCDLRHIFTERYGDSLETFVSPEFVRKLDGELFTNEEKFQVMQSIAEEFSVAFDTKALEIKLWATLEIKDGILEKDSPKQVNLAVPLSNKKEVEEDAICERKSEAAPVGHKHKLEAQLTPKDVHDIQAVATGIDQLNDNTGRQHSEKSDDKEHLKKSASPLDIRKGNTQKEVHKTNKKGGRPCLNELMEAVELDINGLPKQGTGSVKLETECNKTVPPIAKPKEDKKEHGAEKENGTGLGYHHRSRMPGRLDHNREHANAGFKALGVQNQEPSSVNPSSGKTNSRIPPYAKQNGAKGKTCDEKQENGSVLDGRQQHLTDLGKVQDGQRAAARAANIRPPYVKPKFGMQPVNDDPGDPGKRAGSEYSENNISEQTDHLADKDVLRPVSVRRKKPPAPVVPYDEAPNSENVTSRTPSTQRRQSSKQKCVSGGSDRKDNNVDNVVGSRKNVQGTPVSRPSHSGRRNGPSYDDDYDGFMQRHQAGEDETANAFGTLLPQTAEGGRRLKSRNTNVRNGDHEEEEKMMDKLLMHYSKKGLDMGETKTRKETNIAARGHRADTQQCQQNSHMDPPGRVISLPPSPREDLKIPARSTSLQPSVRVHPKMPDFDELAARVIALRNAS